MKRTLIVLALGLLSVGCLTPEQKLRDSVVGEYGFKANGYTYKLVLLEDGICEGYFNGKKEEAKWKIVDGQLHVKTDSALIVVHRINAGINHLDYGLGSRDLSESITRIAKIVDGKRTDYPKEEQFTYKKIK